MPSDRRAGFILLNVFAATLVVLGGAYLLIAATVTLLPGDVRYLGMDQSRLCQEVGCRFTDFITHNRAAYGGATIGSGVMVGWIVRHPLRGGEAWAWWTLLGAGAVQCGGSIAFIAYGHTQAYGFGAWHVGAVLLASLTLAGGLLATRSLLGDGANPIAALRTPGYSAPPRGAEGWGQVFFVSLALGFVLSGLSVLLVALTTVFVPQDVSFLGLDADQVHGVSERLLSLLAHERAEFGVAMVSMGTLVAATAWKGIGVYGWSLWLAIGAAGSVHFAAVITSHFLVGYTDFLHLAPVYGAAVLLAIALYAWRPRRATAARVVGELGPVQVDPGIAADRAPV
jgi:hypothetical protein